MTYIFTFSFNTEKEEAAFAGNIGIQQALQILQSLVVVDAVNKALDKAKLNNTDDVVKKQNI